MQIPTTFREPGPQDTDGFSTLNSCPSQDNILEMMPLTEEMVALAIRTQNARPEPFALGPRVSAVQAEKRKTNSESWRKRFFKRDRKAQRKAEKSVKYESSEQSEPSDSGSSLQLSSDLPSEPTPNSSASSFEFDLPDPPMRHHLSHSWDFSVSVDMCKEAQVHAGHKLDLADANDRVLLGVFQLEVHGDEIGAIKHFLFAANRHHSLGHIFYAVALYNGWGGRAPAVRSGDLALIRSRLNVFESTEMGSLYVEWVQRVCMPPCPYLAKGTTVLARSIFQGREFGRNEHLAQRLAMLARILRSERSV